MDIRPILSALMRHKTAALLIVIEIALTCAIICNALFMITGRVKQIGEVSGIAENQLVRVQILSIGSDKDQTARTRSDLASLRAIPGVKDATVVNQIPFWDSSWNSGVRLDKDQKQSTLNATTYMTEEHFIKTMGLNLVAGRDFNADEYNDIETLMVQARDKDKSNNNDGTNAAIITRALADKLFPGESPVGKVFYSGSNPTRVVGVIEHLVRPNNQGGVEAREYTILFPIRPHYNMGGNYVLRTDPARRAEVIEAAKKALRANGADRIIVDKSSLTFEELRHKFYQAPRAMAWLLGIVCVALLLVTALGIVGLASFWVQQRRKQIGIRRALGATRGKILLYFLTENFLITSIGIALGMLLAFAINQFLMMKYEMDRLDWWYLPIGAVLLWLIGLVAVYAPARRAASIPPAVATRSV